MCCRMDCRNCSGSEQAVPLSKGADIRPFKYGTAERIVAFRESLSWFRSRKLRMAFVPVSLRLKNPGCLHHLCVIQRTSDELNTDRQSNVIKTARHADCRQPTDIADAANGIRKGQRFVQIHIEFGGGHRERGGGQHVNLREQIIHFLLYDSAD